MTATECSTIGPSRARAAGARRRCAATGKRHARIGCGSAVGRPRSSSRTRDVAYLWPLCPNRVEDGTECGRLDHRVVLRAFGARAIVDAMNESIPAMLNVDRAVRGVHDEPPRATARIGAVQPAQIG